MKIVSLKAVIELDMDKRSEKVLVRINGEKIEKVEKLVEARVHKKNEVVVVDLDDVTIEFDGYIIKVKVSENLKNKICGLCGHSEKKTESEEAGEFIFWFINID